MNDLKPTVNWEGREAFEQDMVNIGKGIPGFCKKAVYRSCLLVEVRAKTYHLAGMTLNARSKRLQRSVKSKTWQVGVDEWAGRVGSPVVYAAIHQFGGIIRPVKSKYLVFKIGETWIRTKKVVIPARKWLSKSVDDEIDNIKAIFGKKGLKVLIDSRAALT